MASMIYNDKQITPPPPHYGALDGLRGIAAFLIAFIYHGHYWLKTAIHPFEILFYWPHRFGWTLVQLFFLLSGFIFFQRYSRPISEHSLTPKKYCVLRFSRLYPLHWLTLLITALFVLIRNFYGLSPFQQEIKNNIQLFLLNIPLMQYGWFTANILSFNASAWTLSIEIMMYLLFFILVYFGHKIKKMFFGSIGFVCLGVLLGGIKALFGNPPIPILNQCQGLMGFFMGVIVSGIYSYSTVNKKMCRIITTLCVILNLLSFIFSIVPSIFPFFATILAYGEGYWIIVYTFLLFPPLMFLTLRIAFLTRLFSLRPLRYLGKISYSIYLIHFPVALIITTMDDCFKLKINYSNYIVFFSYMILVMLISHFSHFRFEIPFQNRIRKKYAAL
jgi:peptidoglycan/LPS O-acetylase OafA/YrhL